MFVSHENITIRNAEKSDCPQLAAWWNDGNVMAHAGFPMGLHTTAEKIAESISTDTDDTRRRLILEYENAPIGEMSFRNIGSGAVEIGVKICKPSYQERGIGRKALSLLIQSLFDMGYTKIVIDTNLNNTRAQHVYELLGFQKTGVRIDSWRDQMGFLQSAVDYALTKEDFHTFL